jgi:hypothetical protein
LLDSGDATELGYVQTHVSPLLVGPVKTGLQDTSWVSDGDYAVVLVKSATSYWLYVNVTAGSVLTTSSTNAEGAPQAISHVSRFVCAAN